MIGLTDHRVDGQEIVVFNRIIEQEYGEPYGHHRPKRNAVVKVILIEHNLVYLWRRDIARWGYALPPTWAPLSVPARLTGAGPVVRRRRLGRRRGNVVSRELLGDRTTWSRSTASSPTRTTQTRPCRFHQATTRSRTTASRTTRPKRERRWRPKTEREWTSTRLSRPLLSRTPQALSCTRKSIVCSTRPVSTSLWHLQMSVRHRRASLMSKGFVPRL